MLRGLAKATPRMRLTVTETQRSELEAAAAAKKGVRRGRRYQAVLLLAAGQAPSAVAQTLGCSRASVSAWAAAWRQDGVAELREGDHGGGKVKLDATAEAVLVTLLEQDPQAPGAPRHGLDGAAAAHGVGQRGPRGLAQAGAPCPASPGLPLATAPLWVGTPRSGRRGKKGAVIAAAAAMLAAGGEVWVADETALREFPPLRAGWSRRGEPATVRISGRNTRRTILGTLNVTPGELGHTGRERGRTDDGLAAVQTLGALRPDVPKLPVWDNAPPHHPHRVRDAAQDAAITVALLPFRSPELMPLEDVWRGLKATVAANRCYPSLEELTARAVAWLKAMSEEDRLRRCGFQASKFDWLPT